MTKIWNNNNSEAIAEEGAGSPTVATGLSLHSLQIHNGGFFSTTRKYGQLPYQRDLPLRYDKDLE